ncbi:hypothetical protein [Aquibacillus kalidii]|nr:hypothetical protein [Aquibacillus kalidii]
MLAWFFGIVSMAIAVTAIVVAGAAEARSRKLEERIKQLEKQ